MQIHELKRCLQEIEGVLSKSRYSPPFPSSWSSYLKSSGFSPSFQEQPLKTETLSKLLTYPMTLAYAFDTQHTHKSKITEMHVHVVGARAEATLPAQYWRELCKWTNIKWNVDFYGPDIPTKIDKAEVVAGDFKGRFHAGEYHVEHHDKHKDRLDLVVMYQPGLAHKTEGKKWRNTLEQMLKTKTPTLVTGFNQEDALGDYELVKHIRGPGVELMAPVENVFSNLERVPVPDQPDAVARSNHYIWGFNLKHGGWSF